MTEKENWQLMLEMWEYIRDRIKFIKQYVCINSYEDSLSIKHLKHEFLLKEKGAFLLKEKGLEKDWINSCYFCKKFINCYNCPLGKRYRCFDVGSLYYRACHLDLRAVAWIIRYIKKELKNAE